ncbi:MAG: amino acid ABC transporter ATP-binding protein [Rickettsiales bacterium]|nr:amino acid ABC transporter ATP-binding protein [Rickettsiales bacterium]
MLELKNISKKFADHLVLDDISFNVKPGEVVALIGPSGGGKSTILRSINFLEEIDQGEILFNGISLVKNNINEYRPKIGMVFQHFNLFPHMSVLDNMIFAPQKVLKLSKKDAIQTAMNLLKKVGLKDKAHQFPDALSGGQKQRVAIARSLCMNPEILLLDEPTSALDPEMVQDVLSIIKSFVHTGITIIMATHEMNFAKNFADKIIFLSDGKVMEEAAPAKFFKSPKTKRAKIFLEKILQ